ncbi:MAG: HEAT repeat domain-containing protein [Candidatus Azotimanducaceae bacterium]|uniref:HEAT repeat domain-containing protein n=1 Tax=OM182 bacterium TaxID=2510334 RepID=A0A520S310_9GAMM|nr:hypothetical protein [Gammaproteobacteria bacterium]OUV67004.1 MAG: hypothetical protein CBC93_06790 [Gammaproteobacteria bacterium TMED133]RZO76863.1 MAG: hypothetical protein EVA68_03200 [OM182 bacterium]
MSQSKMSNVPTKANIEGFVKRGYTLVEPSLSEDFHRDVYTQLSRVFQSMHNDFNPHNNILPMVPQLWKVLDDPVVQQTITSILGENYLLHVHRHPHISRGQPKQKTPAMRQPFHKDGHAVKPRPRHREPWWLIMFYYPQTVDLHNGPTGLLPGTHVLPELGVEEDWYNPPKIEQKRDQLFLTDQYVQPNIHPLTCKAGSVAFTHFDIGHGAMMNGTEFDRFACKFVIMRTQRPTDRGGEEFKLKDPVSRHIGRWLGYSTQENENISFADWKAAFINSEIRERVNALYMSASVDDKSAVRDTLLKDISNRLPSENGDWILDIADASNGLALLGEPEPIEGLLNKDNEGYLINGCFSAGQAGDPVFVPRLNELVKHQNPLVQRHAMSALGLIGPTPNQNETISALDSVIRSSSDWDLKVYAIQALIRQGALSETIPGLAIAAKDANTYVNAFAIEQLCRIDDDRARSAVIEPLRRHRWMEDPRYEQGKSL